MNNRFFSIALAMLLGAGYTLDAFSQAKPETLVKQRQSVMTLHGKYMYGDLLAMARGTKPYDAAVVARDVGYLDVLSKMPWDDFSPDTKDVKSIPTRAQQAIFTDTAKFTAAQDRYKGDIAKLVALTKGGTEAAIKEQITATNNSCNSCHDSFRSKQ